MRETRKNLNLPRLNHVIQVQILEKLTEMKRQKISKLNTHFNGNRLIQDDSKWDWRDDYQGIKADFGLMLLMHDKIIGRSHSVGFMTFSSLLQQSIMSGVDTFNCVYPAR